MSKSLFDDLERSSNILLLVSNLSERETCLDLLTVTDPEREDVMSITFTGSPTDRIDVWNQYVNDHPANAAIISVGDSMRSASITSTPQIGPLTINAVSSPADLTGIGIEITEQLKEWKNDGNQIVMCFDSLSILLQFTDLKRVFRFLHVLTGHMKSSDAVAHYHLDPGAHDDSTINTLTSLFDAVVRVQDGELTVTHR